VNVASADAASLDADEQFINDGFWRGHIHQVELPVCGE
jgi:hypothetical protein